jgi:hypothetical protein
MRCDCSLLRFDFQNRFTITVSYIDIISVTTAAAFIILILCPGTRQSELIAFTINRLPAM